ncbi:TonB family protein [Flavobacterium sp. LMO8]|uniref:energy transducer TonB n=1 Tax=Flavobacterium sp. LMO8 TaxID=2654244 RepID=UPI001291EDF9|nr:energy transducer TonB [Flavobacterium sp. LMO8]MQP25327.1 TonB family protein [Flavobacterium sp. LMO8]
MKANVDFPKRAKNSFIYFQVGLIATMVVVLFILEFSFENKNKVITDNHTIEIYPEPTFVYNPAPATKPVETTKPVVVKVPKVAHVFKATKDEPKKEEDKTPLATQDNPADNPKTDTTPTDNPKDNGGEITVTPTVFSVEQLPMFEACKGLSRAAQKECFDEQMAKAIAKHLVYPDSDLENGRQGVALVEFVIDESGAITNVKALDNKRATVTMQRAAEKAVKRIPKLSPAMHGKKPVKIKYSIPVGFRMK